jgi:hypothetical protein
MEGARDRSPEALNDLHAAAAAWTQGSLVVGRRIRIIVLIRAPILWRRGHIEQLAAQRELFRAMAIRKESIVTNPMEAVRQNVKEEAAYEFIHLELRDLSGATAILAAEADVVPIFHPIRPRMIEAGASRRAESP